jgi:hypothetical protein
MRIDASASLGHLLVADNATNQHELVDKVRALVKGRFGDVTLATLHKLFNQYATPKGVVDRNGLVRLLQDAGVGNDFTRGFWADGILDHFDKPDAQGRRQGAITWSAFQAGIGNAVS